jgi:hypothetical protein
MERKKIIEINAKDAYGNRATRHGRIHPRLELSRTARKGSDFDFISFLVLHLQRTANRAMCSGAPSSV